MLSRTGCALNQQPNDHNSLRPENSPPDRENVTLFPREVKESHLRVIATRDT